MLTELQKRKFTRYFHCLDSDRNGYLEKGDFEAILENMAALRGFRAGSPEYSGLRAGVMSIWENMAKHAAPSSGGRCTLDDWFAMEDENLADPARYETYAADVAKGLFDMIDLDGDGKIQVAEWISFYKAFCRLPEGAARESFAHLDLNKDGILSKDETIAAVREFHCSDDVAAPGNWLFGRW